MHKGEKGEQLAEDFVLPRGPRPRSLPYDACHWKEEGPRICVSHSRNTYCSLCISSLATCIFIYLLYPLSPLRVVAR